MTTTISKKAAMCENAPGGCRDENGTGMVLDSIRSKCGLCGGYLDSEPPLYAPKNLDAYRTEKTHAYTFDVTTGPAPVAGIVFAKD